MNLRPSLSKVVHVVPIASWMEFRSILFSSKDLISAISTPDASCLRPLRGNLPSQSSARSPPIVVPLTRLVGSRKRSFGGLSHEGKPHWGEMGLGRSRAPVSTIAAHAGLRSRDPDSCRSSRQYPIE